MYFPYWSDCWRTCTPRKPKRQSQYDGDENCSSDQRNKPISPQTTERINGRLRKIGGQFQFVPDVPKIVQRLLSRLIPVVLILCQRFFGYRLPQTCFGTRLRQRLWISLRNRYNDVSRGWSCKRLASGNNLMEHYPQTPDVRAFIDLKSTRLLRRHVGDCSH